MRHLTLETCSPAQFFLKLSLYYRSVRAYSARLGICSVHNRNRLFKELKPYQTPGAQCTPATPCILDNAGEKIMCIAHKSSRKYTDLIQNGEIMTCHELAPCGQKLKMCAKHKRVRPLDALRATGDVFICTKPSQCDKKVMCDVHREYRYTWHLVRYKNSHICRHDARCVHHSDSMSKAPVEKFVYLDELWGDGEDIVVNKVEDLVFQNKRIIGNVMLKK